MTQVAAPATGTLFRNVAIALAVWLVIATAVLFSGPPEAGRATFSSIALATTAIIAASSCLLTAVRSQGRRRRAWALLAAAGYVGCGGNMAAAITGTTQTGDLAYLGALLLGVLALLSFPSRRMRSISVARMVLDGVVVGGSILFLAAIAVFPERAAGDTTLSGVIALILPLVDAMLVTLAVFLITRSSRSDRLPLLLVALSFMLYALADLSYAMLGIAAFSLGTPVDLGWIAGYGLGGLAARHVTATGAVSEPRPDAAVGEPPPDGAVGEPRPDGAVGEPRPEEVSEVSPVPATVITFVLFILAAAVGIAAIPRSPWDVLALVLWVVVLVAVAARQTILVVDNERLRQDLERRVRSRTSELRSMTRSTELLLSSVGDGIYGVDRRGHITFVNPAAVQTLGYSEAELVGRDAHATFHAPARDGRPFPIEGCYISEAIHAGLTASAEEDAYRRHDGTDVPVEVTASPLLDGPSVRGAVVVFRDVTQRREIDRMKDEFVSVISHELRTPLTSIRGSLGLLAGGAVGELSPQARRMTTIAMESSERLSRLISDVLEIERIAAGTTAINPADHDIRVLIEAAINEIDGTAKAAGIVLRIGQVSGRVHVDSDRIIQTLINILGNAIKFSPAHSEVVVSTHAAEAGVEVQVTDKGRGIPEEDLERIFDRFEQVDASDARDKGGTGLGLAICRSIVQNHGGRIWATSTIGAGSTFHVTLPRADGRRPPTSPNQ